MLLADPIMLEKIDKLFACNVGEHVDPSQLVVVGDQSSGKSSVLEGLPKLKFPRSSGLCIRFATQIIFRRNPNLKARKVSGSIISKGHEHGVEISPWAMSDIDALSEKEFEKMMFQVHVVMGLSSSTGDNLPSFSADVLRLEINGPHEEHLSVIDVPGIFKTTTPGLTSKPDIALVRNMVLGYMKNTRSIMLAVVPANVDVATQEIIEMARELDPDGIRTLRILTKPDLVDEGTEDKIIELVQGKQESEELGWVVVRNLGQKDFQDTSKDRDIEEEGFFQSTPWNRLSKENCDVQALTARLQALLISTVQRDFPSVRLEVSRRLKKCEKALESLGEERESSEKQRKYLLTSVSKFQRITENALTTNYGTQDVFEEQPLLRLATLVANRNADLSDDFATSGHVYNFNSHAHDDDLENKNPTVTTASGTATTVTSKTSSQIPTALMADDRGRDIPSRRVNTCTEIGHILHQGAPIQNPKAQGILSWNERLYQESRGFEIGTFNASILSSVLRKQSAKWPLIAEGYICDIVSIVHSFTSKALEISCGDPKVAQNIMSSLMDDLFQRYRKAISMTEFLLVIERERTPMTMNHYLNSNLRKCNNKATIQDIHDILKSYYKVARKRFIDNLCMQATDYHLVTGPAAPMKLFSPSWVYNLSPEQLEQIAGQKVSIRAKRCRLQKQIKGLEIGRKILLH
ncbi:hypothetical protein N7520_002989 [Penicillium odoratum]|uniref:uncharacterized protein n=1 Tax=Penicillium odoratum TaxID=1167516 RepID=UPI0025489BDD|nr:uncharacterized protein N7520_002989 [Penicillium odoratum]KAJ5772460.1 hypothetical protein N7520_002989 [Penicillium odoratum]